MESSLKAVKKENRGKFFLLDWKLDRKRKMTIKIVMVVGRTRNECFLIKSFNIECFFFVID